MTQEDKELLLKDLSARLPYGVKIRLGDYDYQVCGYNSEKEMPLKIWYYYDSNQTLKLYVGVYLTDYHPYLRPMSSMTEEEREELEHLSEEYFGKALDKQIQESLSSSNRNKSEILEYIASSVIVDWLNSNHFDFRGLIEKGLAIETTEGMYK